MLKTTLFKFFKHNCIFKFLTELPIILLSDVHTFFSNKYLLFAINVLIDADLFVCSDNNGSLSSDFFLSIRRELLKGCRVINICSILVSLAIVSWYSEMSPLSKDITELLNHRLSPKIPISRPKQAPGASLSATVERPSVHQNPSSSLILVVSGKNVGLFQVILE